MTENYILYAELELQRLVRGAAPRPLPGVAGAHHVREAASERAKELGRDADLQLDVNDAQVPLASAHLRKVVSETVDNAFKFSEPGKAVTVSLRSSGAAVVLEIADSGRGMTPDQIRDVAAFRQFDRALFEQQGSGLGLALVRALIDGSGGRFEITSRPGEGTRARASWPVSRAPA
jgi:signal transduction histidine kinase